MRRLLLGVVFLAACSGDEPNDPQPDAPDNLPACTMAVFDQCVDNADCTSGNCHLFSQSGFSVCTQACTPNDNSTCPTDKTGANGQCNNKGICKPAQPNDCSPQ